MNDTDEIKKPQGVGEKDEELENFTEGRNVISCVTSTWIMKLQ